MNKFLFTEKMYVIVRQTHSKYDLAKSHIDIDCCICVGETKDISILDRS